AVHAAGRIETVTPRTMCWELKLSPPVTPRGGVKQHERPHRFPPPLLSPRFTPRGGFTPLFGAGGGQGARLSPRLTPRGGLTPTVSLASDAALGLSPRFTPRGGLKPKRERSTQRCCPFPAVHAAGRIETSGGALRRLRSGAFPAVHAAGR